ncbi:hypothetical protein B0H15DRAFT_807503 [Mycena belliarum]|uniref:Uncharacterized protein n=1 Tax=Mycena belliarum TaxID=1033014 RepID=A0AAD6TQK1_9AGAR|nr:hypothetical protein B0H15DRAFT_807503 [Mycena belliae]
MPSSYPGCISSADEAIVRRLFKVVRATKFEDAVDQAAFLEESATTVLRYRSHTDSFARITELGECVFTIRAMMHANRVHLPASPSTIFSAIQDFAGEIVRKRHLFQERQHANADRIRLAAGVAARIARKAALDAASSVAVKSPSSAGSDIVSIPPTPAESSVPDLQSFPPSAAVSPIKTDGPDLVQRNSEVLPSRSPLSPLRPSNAPEPAISHDTAPGPRSFVSSSGSMPPLNYTIAKLALVIRPLPTGPRARLRPHSAPAPSKRRRVEEGKNTGAKSQSSAPHLPYARPSRPVQYAAGGIKALRPTTSEPELRQRLAAVQAELRRYSSAQKELFWQLAIIRQLESTDSSSTSQLSAQIARLLIRPPPPLSDSCNPRML